MNEQREKGETKRQRERQNVDVMPITRVGGVGLGGGIVREGGSRGWWWWGGEV